MKFSSLLLGLILVSPVFADVQGEPPVAVRTVAPEFPYEMKRNGVSGLVTVSCMIDAQGNVQEPKVEKSTAAAFEQPALEAVQKWKFKPAKRDGNPVAMRIAIPIKFVLNGN